MPQDKLTNADWKVFKTRPPLLRAIRLTTSNLEYVSKLLHAANMSIDVFENGYLFKVTFKDAAQKIIVVCDINCYIIQIDEHHYVTKEAFEFQSEFEEVEDATI